MKVNGQDPLLVAVPGKDSVAGSTIPVRLWIATEILAGMYACPTESRASVELAIEQADKLISAHNKTTPP